MLYFHQINNIDDPLFEQVYELYASAFPAAERRTCAGLEFELVTENRFQVNALMRHDEFVGFFNFWTFDNFNYIEHFAVNSLFRSQHIGSEALTLFKAQNKLPIILEVEMPNDPMASRRILFYERLGFSVLSHDYAQPPYHGNGFLLPMLIMCNNQHFANTHFDLIRNTLYQEVYKYNLNTDRG